jgi:hypothetical protein
LTPLLLVTACEGPFVSSYESEIVGGTIDTGDPAVAAVLIQMADGTTVAICSGTLISPRVILTAAHCVSINDPKIPGAAPRQVFFGNDVEARPLALIDVVRSTFHPSFNERALDQGNDIALLLLDRSPSGITPLPINRSSMSSQIGIATRLVGFGITGGGRHDDGTKRQVSSIVGNVDAKLLWVLESSRNTCNGDSGGPSFVTIGGKEVIAGITSFGDEDCVQAGAYTRVDLYASSFIDPWVQANDAPAMSDACVRDGVCSEDCVPADPDCAAEPPPPICVADGMCVSGCTTTPDPDCTDGGGGPGVISSDEGIEGGCAVGAAGGAGQGGGAAGLLVGLALVLAARRRRPSSQSARSVTIGSTRAACRAGA